MTQAQRVLKALQERGPVGLTVNDFDGSLTVIDGGARIKRLAARVDELRKQGHNITTTFERVNGAKFARYRLTESVVVAYRPVRQEVVEAHQPDFAQGAGDVDAPPLFDDVREEELEWV